jgi:hypothetical protein
LLNDTVNIRLEGSYALPTIVGTRGLRFNQAKKVALKEQLLPALKKLFE